MTLREIWIQQVEPDDYERHMAAVGQAEVNAGLVRELFAAAGVEPGARVLVAGAGTGQMFSYLPAGLFENYRLVCSDISPRMLERLQERVLCEVVVDDIEESRLEPGFGAIVVVLVLEHVDFRRALTSIARLGAGRLIVVIQKNPPGVATAVTRPVPESMRVPPGSEPQLIAIEVLTGALREVGFEVSMQREVDVADGKKMIGLLCLAA